MKNSLKDILKNRSESSLGIVDNETPFAIKEAYRALYTNVLYLNIEDKCRKIAITSAIAAEGKTTLALNLAITLAQNLEGKRILLIDADMRKPRVSERLSLNTNSHGLSEYLAGIDDDPHFDYIPQYKLMVLCSGSQNVNPTKLIGSEKMRKLIEACEDEFDYVIIDTPPINVVTDALLLNKSVNGYIISTRAEHSNLNGVSECVSKLEQVGAEIFGIVLTDVKLKGYNSKYSKYSYKN